METAKIRQAGFPIRYSYAEFVHRYRLLVPDIPPPDKTDCKKATRKICSEVLKNQEYRLGHTKVFLKHAHDSALEEMRHQILMKAVIRAQANARRFIARQHYLRLRYATILIQKNFRARGLRLQYLIMRKGYLRMQAAIKSRELRRTFVNIRRFLTKFQAECRRFLVAKMIKEKGQVLKSYLADMYRKKEEHVRDVKKSKAVNTIKEAEDEFEKKYNEVIKSIWTLKELPVVESPGANASAINDRYVDDVFGFLKDNVTPVGTVRDIDYSAVSITNNTVFINL